MSDLKLSDMGKGITELAKAVTASETEWNRFKSAPQAYADKYGYAVSLSQSQVNKIKDTSYAQAKAALVSTDLNSAAGLW